MTHPHSFEHDLASGRPPRAARLPAVALALLAAGAAPAVAQFDQYTEPGGPTARPEERKEQLERAIEDARWRLGVVRLAPWFGVYDVRYVDNAFGSPSGEEVSDVTGTVGAGLRAYLRNGPKVVWAAHVLPEYVGWQKLEDKRSVNGRYGLGVFGFFNRMTVEALAERDQLQRLGSPEVPEPVHQRWERAQAAVQVEATGHMTVFAAGEAVRLRSLIEAPEEAPLDRLDRDAAYLRAGLRWRLPRDWSLGAGVERSQVDFDTADPRLDRSNSGTSPLVEVRLDRPNHYLRLEAAYRELDPEPGSSFVAFAEPTGGLELGLGTEARLAFWIYARRGLVYSIEDAWGYAVDDRAGVASSLRLGTRSSLTAFVESGTMDFVATLPGTPARRDDVVAFGGGFSTGVVRSLTVSLLARRLDFQSSLPGLDRGVTSFGFSVDFGGRRGDW